MILRVKNQHMENVLSDMDQHTTTLDKHFSTVIEKEHDHVYKKEKSTRKLPTNL